MPIAAPRHRSCQGAGRLGRPGPVDQKFSHAIQSEIQSLSPRLELGSYPLENRLRG